MSAIVCTFVIPTRNDGYGGSTPESLAANINYLIDGLKESENNFEIILIEWNVIEDVVGLSVSLQGKILRSENVAVRIYSVPGLVHQTFRYWRLASFCPHGAINFGVRRAKGKFCIVKMQDTVYSRALLNWFSDAEFNDRFVYRADRVDVDPNLLLKTSLVLDEIELFNNGYRNLPIAQTSLHTNACGDFMLMPLSIWFKIRGEGGSRSVRMYGPDGLTLAKAVGIGLRENRLPNNMVVFKPMHDSIFNIRSKGSAMRVPTGDSIIFVPIVKRLKVFRLAGKFFRDMLLAILNLPKNYDGRVPVDSIYRFVWKYRLRLCFSKWFRFGRADWGAKDVSVESISLN